MKKLYNQYDKYTPDMEFNKDSEEEVLLMLEKQAEITDRKGLCLTMGRLQHLTGNKSTAVSPIYGDKITPYHNHDFYEINYVLKGKLANFVEGRPYLLEEGDLLIMNPSIHHIAYPVGKVLAKNVILLPEFVEKTAELLSAGKKPNY